MKGRVESGQLVTIAPVVDPGELRVDDIVLCQVRGAQYLHLIKAVNGERFLIGNNRGGTNGRVGFAASTGSASPWCLERQCP
jgi:hypothetical protein